MSSKSSVGLKVSELATPALLVDKAIMEANCSKMLTTCASMGLTLRAQTKTHKTVEGAVLQTGGTKQGLVTSTLDEAEFYADHGFDDLLYGYPFIPFHLTRVTQLTRRLNKFHVMVDSCVAVETLAATTPPPGKTWSVFLKVDCGNKRAGVWWSDSTGVELAYQLHQASNITLAGVYVHCGNSYATKQAQQVDNVRDQTIERLVDFVGRVKGRGVSLPTVGIGSTPTCTRPGPNMKLLTELHPGNYIFLDVQQVTLGSGKLEDIACCVATRVIGHYPHRNQMLIDCGFTGLTKQGQGQLPSGYCIFRDQPHLKLLSMTQEIGCVESIEGSELNMNQYPIGSLLYILPWHSCATAGMYPVYHIVEGGRVVDEWRPTRGW